MLRDTVLITAAIELGLLEAEQVAPLQTRARRERKELLRLLSFSLRLPLSAFYRAYAELHDIAYSEGPLQVDEKGLRKLPRSLTERRLILPLQSEDEALVPLAVADPQDQAGIEQARRMLGKPVSIQLVLPSLLQRSLARFSPKAEDGQGADEFDPVAMLNQIFDEAYLSRASDIHFEPQKEHFQIRLRIDGHLQHYPEQLSIIDGQALMSRMKVLAGMDIAEQRQSQDGNLSHHIDETGAEFDVRAATLPTRFGERATLRLLGADSQALSLEQVGFSDDKLAQFRKTIRRPYGMVLITGPTGSGKSTTLYSALQEIASDDINVMTAEDPVEYVMPGISQVHVNTKVSFADALRSFLRHDPDVIMVGEIRDGETANIAMKAAMTGHLVFSTLHTNSALSSISRLVDMGVERYLIGATLAAVIAQRLVRRLCPHCKQAHPASPAQLRVLELEDEIELYRAQGCASCMGSGYRGRLALFETLWLDDQLGELIAQQVDESCLRREAMAFCSLAEDGRQKLLAGHTSWDELARLALIEPLSAEVAA